jgi:hypothetical protein
MAKAGIRATPLRRGAAHRGREHVAVNKWMEDFAVRRLSSRTSAAATIGSHIGTP